MFDKVALDAGGDMGMEIDIEKVGLVQRLGFRRQEMASLKRLCKLYMERKCGLV